MPADQPKKSLEERILEDIEKTGFPLELRVAHELLTRGFFVQHNVYYVDKDEQKGREIEIVGLQNSQNPPRDQIPMWVRNMVLVECKKSNEKPWVIFTSTKTFHDDELRALMQTGMRDTTKLEADTVASVTAYHPYWLLPRRGRSYYEAFRGTEKADTLSSIFKALTTVVKATLAQMAQHDNITPQLGDVRFYHPIVVLEGQLFEAYLDDTKKIVLARPKWIPISFAYESPHYKSRRFTILVVEEQHLPELLKELEETLQAWVLLLGSNPTLAVAQK